MSVKQYGIYLAYAPTVDVRHEGLGRYLAAFLKGASLRADVRFVLVCPSWSRESLENLLESEGIAKGYFTIIAPKAKPLILRGYEVLSGFRKSRHKAGFIKRFLVEKALPAIAALTERTFRRLAQVRSIFSALVLLLDFGFWLGLLVLVLSPLLALLLTLKRIYQLPADTKKRLFGRISVHKSRWNAVLKEPKESMFVFRFFKQMEAVEAKRMLQLIDRLKDVRAWYSPAAFWPAFNEISTPRLMCLPDVVLTDFSVGFSILGGNRFLANFEAVEASIRSNQHFVVYSGAVKWETLVDRYAVRAANVTVVHHAPNRLDKWVTVCGFDDVEKTSRHYCEGLLSGSLRKSSNPRYSKLFLNGSVKFLFYASQFRPNKNLITLLRSYVYLLRERFIGHKLVLTGKPHQFPPVLKFIKDHGLENEVLCLHGLKIQELAACYKLADLAVNPSLSEGGCPFTFTEALSVDTPVVMARIPVTEEVLTDPELQEVSFFDPYDWKDMAYRIEWALKHRDQLLTVQRRTYTELSKRSWTDVVNEHIGILERISADSEPAEAQRRI